MALPMPVLPITKQVVEGRSRARIAPGPAGRNLPLHGALGIELDVIRWQTQSLPAVVYKRPDCCAVPLAVTQRSSVGKMVAGTSMKRTSHCKR